MDDALVNGLRAWLEARAGAPVAVRETPISWVLLTPRLALKLKKPVRLPFLDFTSLQARRHFCEEELRLNRRLAPALYRRVLAVRGTPAAPHVGGEGPLLDHVVCMRRFPDSALLAERVDRASVRPEEIDRLAERLAAFHRTAARVPAAAAADPVAQALATVERLREAGGARVDDLHAWLAARALALGPVFAQRRASGAIREGHGDLHLGNLIACGDQVTAFDCIEFDPALRRIDVIDDIAFASMDLLAHGRADLAFRFLDGYLQATGDHAGVRVLAFYQVYRACVRALVAALGRVMRPRPDYLGCAHALANAPDTPALAVMHGVSGSGKSTLALALLEAAGAFRVRSDVERKRLHGLEPHAPGGAALYADAATARTYEALHERVRVLLEARVPVIVDAACLRRGERDAFADLAARCGVPCTVIACQAAPATLRERVAARQARGGDPSDADGAVLERQLGWCEPIAPDEAGRTIRVDTTAPVDAAALARQWLARAPAPGPVTGP